MSSAETRRRRVGIIGFGHLGQTLVSHVMKSADLELAFVWNRNKEILKGKVDEQFVLDDLGDLGKRMPDLVIEVAHPDISRRYGESILQVSDYMIGSPTALADEDLARRLERAATHHAVYIPSGALWGGEDIRKMADAGTLQKLRVSMAFHPHSLKLVGNLHEKNKNVSQRTVLYDGCVRELCSLAPNNVNTMAAAAVAGSNLGFGRVEGCLISDPELTDRHVVEVEAWGEGDIAAGKAFHVKTTRYNPAAVGLVTGLATRSAFVSSVARAFGKGPGIHLC